MKKRVIWIDITNVPHVNFLLPIIHRYKEEYCFVYSVRDFAETKGLFEKRIGEPYFLVGKHAGGNKWRKVLGSFWRIFELQRTIPHFDVKISVGGDASSIVAKLRGKLSITFDDNEMAPNWRYAPFADLAFFPKAIDREKLYKQRFKDAKLYQYDGFKEDMYLADYVPDEDFPKSLPFTNYVVVRPENIGANYVAGKTSIVPELLKELEARNYNVLYLPRYESDKTYAEGIRNLYIPSTAVNGLDACYYADAVLTGAGTMAREAACLGVPAVSFYTGDELLTVDKTLIGEDKMFFSRSVSEITDFLSRMARRTADLERCRRTQAEIFAKSDEVLR